MSDTAIVAGIDEAGYGPILGPLVVSATAFEAPASLAGSPLWPCLSQSVVAAASCRKGRIPILDSKRLYSRKGGLGRLERSVLAVISAWRGTPPSLHGLLGLLCPELLSRLPEYPWYRASDPTLPRQVDRAAVRLAGVLLAKDMAQHSIQPRGFWCEVLPEGHYNRLVTTTKNKAVVLSGLTLRLIQRIADACPGRPLRFCVDKQGGRAAYGPILLRAFDDRRLKVINESQDNSEYELVRGEASWRISFSQSGESRHLATAFASMISKYVRELLMECFNSYWTSQVPRLKSTAGYYEDGIRFLKEVRPHLRRLGVDESWLVRQR